MTRKSAAYAEALLKSLQKASAKEQQARVRRFRNLLKKQGDLRLLSSILQEFKKLWELRQGKIARVVSAKKLPLSLKESMKKALKRKGYQTREENNESLIGGAAVFLGNEYLIDRSVQGKLRKLQSILK